MVKRLTTFLKAKKLHYREDILDNMNEDELAANLFRITQTKQKLLKDNIKGKKAANDVHYEVGKILSRKEIEREKMIEEKVCLNV